MTIKAESDKKKLLVLTSTFPRWNGDHEPPFVFELCRRLQNCFDVLVLAPHAPGAKSREMLDGIDVIRFRYFFSKWETLAYRGGIMANLKQHVGNYLLVPCFLISQLVALYRILKREKIDVIHAHWLIPQGLIAIAARILCGTHYPILCTSHGSDLLGLPGAILSALKRWVMRRVDALTVVSQSMSEYARMLDAPADKLAVIPMGIDMVETFIPAYRDEEETAELLFVGRLVEAKAVGAIIQAMPAILAVNPEVILSIAGEGPEETRLKALAKTLGITNKVHFLGAVPNDALPPIYRRATVFISPSLMEGFGLTLVEALACKCAVIASDLPAVRELIIDGETGFIISPGNHEEITSKVLTLLANRTLRQSLAHSGRESVLGRFDWDTVAGNYSVLLHELAVSHCSRSSVTIS